MPYRNKKRKKQATNRKKIIAAGFGLILIVMLLAFILILLPERKNTDTGGLTSETETTQPTADSTQLSESQELGTNVDKEQNALIARNDVLGPPQKPLIMKGSISIVIDDVGYSISELKPFLLLPGHVTFAVLPELQYSREASRLIREAGKDLLLHLPMESENGNDPGPGALYVGDDPQKIAKIIESDLDTVPGAIGVNNHMGSKASADMGTMSSVFSALQGKGIFFLDSKTTPDSKAKELGSIFGVEVIERDIFLDNETSPEAILSQVEKGLSIAEETGSCVFIGHVQNKAVYEVLRAVLPQIEKKSYKLITLTKLTGESKT